MKNITVSVDEELYDKMKEFEFVNWSAATRIALRKFIGVLEEEGLSRRKYEDQVFRQLLEILK